MRAPERLTRTVLMVSLALAIGAPLAWNATTPQANAGTLPATEVAETPLATTANDARTEEPQAVGATIDAAADTADRATAPRSASAVATRSARIGDLEQAPDVAPRRLQIPSLKVNAAIGAIGVERNGAMEVPEDVRDVGWYRFGPAPGEPGATVIAGHVDSREQGAGAFFNLRRLEVGARVKVVEGSGDVRRYDVVARRTYDKAVLPTADLFAREGPSQLVLITCGGDFDSTAGSYQDNVVIYAQPLSSSK